MNKYEKALLDCKIGIKAFQNIKASSVGFSKILDLAEIKDPVLMSSIFYWAVIRYAKPFLNSQFEDGKRCYKTKDLKKVNGFSEAMHKHLITVRNTLVAHDDFTEITPRLLTSGMIMAEEDFFIPTSVAISNKCISYPLNFTTVQQMQLHTQTCCNGVHSKLIEDIEELRSLTLRFPEMARENSEYESHYGETKIEANSSPLIQPPDFLNDQWLNTPVPDYSELHNGYMYEEERINKDFHGPEKIVTPKGMEFNISPTVMV
jgi:hypothetical protein